MRSGRYLSSVREALPEDARANLDLALSGDALAARRLMIVAPRRLRGHIASLAYQRKTPNPAYREIIRAVWAPQTRHLFVAHWSTPVVRRMLARAEFRIPDLNGPVTIYHAVDGIPVRRAATELSWTTSRDAAIQDAVKSDEKAPRILQATIEPADVIYWGNAWGEQEVVSRRPIHAPAVECVSLPERPRRSALHQG